ncbi:related to DUF895 domain membrane protein [Melanopsichium pennsylvanicum]|uniref:Related to DUF895 domain membrane protein n=2 Tax=Melanopsichium pennsylvanicum TaxID=63383 RepID=A0AAJ4XSB1_9BASI|nr:mfs general substrate transporter [Melanopsichium pennsylvanicum 4]SNX87423.1 related to DUF895 domain membrane protein [Melanopsichium pennsylvanicum]
MASEKQFDAASSSSSGPKHVEPDSQADSHIHPTTLAAVPAVERSSNPVLHIYSMPVVQVALVGMVCFLCPGCFNALSGIGGGGQVNSDASNKAAIALYSTFSAVSFFAGTIHNKLGSRLTLGLGALGYCLYVGAFLSYNINANQGFVIAAGAILGVCASLLWTAQGALMLAYPTESQKGRFISVFWVIFNLGAVLGAAIELGLTYNSTANTVSNGTYAAFVVLTGLGALFAAALMNPAKVVRDDGSRVLVPSQTTWAKELMGLFVLLRSDPWVVLLFPMFLASNWFYTWQFNDYNGALFTLRTRSLNNLLYWLSQMVGSLAIGQILDTKSMSRKSRAWLGWCIVFVVMWCVWGGSYDIQKTYTRATVLNETQRIDFNDRSKYVGYCFLYIFSGILDAIWQNLAYWLIGACSNDLSKLGYLAGFYKSIQSAGAAGAFAMDNDKHPYMTNLAVTWDLCAAGLLFVIPVIALRVKEHTDPLQEVTVPGRAEEIAAVDQEISEKQT